MTRMLGTKPALDKVSTWPELPSFDPEPSIEAGLAILEELGLPFAMTGRLAVWAYVPPRNHHFTRDVDFLVPGGADQAALIAEQQGLTTKDLIVLDRKFGKAVDGENVCVDFVDDAEYRELFEDAVTAAILVADPDARYPVVSVDYLIVMKVAAYRDTDQKDIKSLLPCIRKEDYKGLKDITRYYLGGKAVGDLDILARQIGHPGPGPDWNPDDYGL